MDPETATDSICVISRGSVVGDTTKGRSQHVSVRTRVFAKSSNDSYSIVLVVTKEQDAVDIGKLRALMSYDEELIVIPDENVESLFGYTVDAFPPFGYMPVNSTLIVDPSLVEECQMKSNNNLLLLCGAGHPYWQSLLSVETLLRLGNVQVSSILQDDDSKHIKSEASYMKTVDDALLESVVASSSFRPPPRRSDSANDLPYFPIDGPPLHLARLVSERRDLSNPLSPVFVTTVGRIGSIKRRTKKSLSCEFLPPSFQGQDPPRQSDFNKRDQDDRGISKPWRCARSNNEMAVDLLLGKALLQTKGTKRGERFIKDVQEGQLVLIEGKTNPGRRESLKWWVESMCLELEVLDYQPLDSTKNELTEAEGNETRRGVSTTTSVESSLSLQRLFTVNASVSTMLVDNEILLDDFSVDISRLLERTHDILYAGGEDEPTQLSVVDGVLLVGIDCEWQPSKFMEPTTKGGGRPQPVLLLQISLNALDKIYILDLQAMLRPLKDVTTSMNQLEVKVSTCLEKLFSSKLLVKTGYQLASDFQRLAASYPHITCFQQVHSVLEVAGLIKRILHVSKQKRSRYITTSLSAMTSHYLGMKVDKAHQVSDWAVRPLTPDQMEYAALDAAVSPILVQRSLGSIGGYITVANHTLSIEDSVPVLERSQGDMSLSKEILSWRFGFIENYKEDVHNNLKAGQVVGSHWVCSQSWTATETPPDFPISEILGAKRILT